MQSNCSHRCPHCNKTFSSRQGKYQHVHSFCKVKNLTKLRDQNPHKQSNELCINSFGEESLTDVKIELFGNNDDDLRQGLLYIMKYIFLTVPQNNNVRIHNIKGKTVEIYNNGVWTIVPQNIALEDMVKKCTNILQSHCTQTGLMNDAFFDKLSRSNSQIFYTVRNDFRAALLQARKNPINSQIQIVSPDQKIGYVYLLREREFIKCNECIVKVGRATLIKERFIQYPKGSELLWCLKVHDIFGVEHRLIRLLHQNFKHRSDIGAEYFEGNIQDIVDIVSVAAVNKLKT